MHTSLLYERLLLSSVVCLSSTVCVSCIHFSSALQRFHVLFMVNSLNVGSGTSLVIQTHQQSILKTFIRSRSGFLIPTYNSAIPESPKLCQIRLRSKPAHSSRHLPLQKCIGVPSNRFVVRMSCRNDRYLHSAISLCSETEKQVRIDLLTCFSVSLC